MAGVVFSLLAEQHIMTHISQWVIRIKTWTQKGDFSIAARQKCKKQKGFLKL